MRGLSALDAVERNKINTGEMARKTERVLDHGVGSPEMAPEIGKARASKHIGHELEL